MPTPRQSAGAGGTAPKIRGCGSAGGEVQKGGDGPGEEEGAEGCGGTWR